MNITICGGGNIAHALAVVLSQTDAVSVLTRKPDAWSHVLAYKKGLADYRHSGILQGISAAPSVVVDGASLIIIAVPRFATSNVVNRIKPYLHRGQTVAFIPAPSGMESIAEDLQITCGVDVIGFQRVPYIARIQDYGHSVVISDDRAVHKVVVSNNIVTSKWDSFFTERFGGKIEHLSSFFAFTFSNANALLHPARLMVLLKRPYYDHMPLFYREWTDESSELYVKSDAEMSSVMRKFKEIDLNRDYESALDHYGVKTSVQLTEKIRSIPSFKEIKAPYIQDETGNYVPDFTSRYFTEDVAYGTIHIQKLAREVAVPTPTIDMFVNTIQGML